MADESPVASPGGQAQQAPFGTSPVTGPTPNAGFEAAGVQRLGIVIKMMTDILPLVGATSELGQALMKNISALAKFVPPGAVTPAAEKQNIEQMAFRNAQNTQMMQQMKPQQAGGMPGQAAAPPAMSGQRAA